MKMLILRFFDTLGKNEELKECYNQIESIYNSKLNFPLENDAEIEDHGATEDEQGAESDISSHSNQTNIFSSKFSNALGKLLNEYYDSSLLQHHRSKKCVYFKYWFCDKILKNIFSDEKLDNFYKEIEGEDKEDEPESESESISEEDVEQIKEEFMEEEVEQEEDEFEDGSLIPSDEEDTEGSDYAQNGESQHRSKGEDNDSDKILLSLDKSQHCNIYKLKLNQIKDIKILYDYLEDKNNNRSFIEAIRKSTYCSTFNKTIELYIDKSKCKSNDFVNAYCREVEECSKNDSLTNISILRCAEAESTSGTLEQVVDNKELEGKRPQSFPSEHGACSDSTTSSLPSCLLDTIPENVRGVGFIYFLIDLNELGSTAFHYGDNMKERQPFVDGEHITDRGNLNTQILSSGIMRGSRLMDTKASNPCDNGKVGRSCESFSQTLSTIHKETGNHLKMLQENTNVHNEPDKDSQEDTDSTNTIVSSASSVLGVSALAFMLYKFTPLGSLINNRRGGMDTWDINEEGYDENLLFSSALGNTNSNNNNYSIGYYSLGNT
ncbi:PIR Superfamily Protein [Plasmodium ovale curtisi]|uniref:PIR Superfamily Protein n=1 Tax=Plasmodium ovale curtisi TaxID=864141 RepID=A0A1A8WP37_PLAOA|nr:PIR Superfamily Protein [Plasmodium ovale curtisi]